MLAASNKPFDLDEAVLKRFKRQEYMPLPDDIARFQFMEFLFGETFGNFNYEETD